MIEKTLLLFLLVDVTIATYYYSSNDNQAVDTSGSLGFPAGCQCSCDRPEPRPEPRRVSEVLPAVSRRRRRRKERRRKRVVGQRVTNRVLGEPVLSNDRVIRGSRGINVVDVIPQSSGFGQIDNGFDNGFVDNGFENGNGIETSVVNDVGGFPVETNDNGGFGSDFSGGMVVDNSIRDRFNGDGFASIGGIREGSSGYGRHRGKYSRSHKRHKRRHNRY